MIQIIDRPIDLNSLLPQICHPECGAQVMFVGTTRQWTGEVETAFLEYEAYEQLALNQMRSLEAEARQRWPVREVVMVHRVGRVEVTEPSVAVLVSSPHRSEAFEAARWLIDALKHHVPIWKREHYVQRGAEWIHPTSGSCNCHAAPAVHPPVMQSQASLQSSAPEKPRHEQSSSSTTAQPWLGQQQSAQQ